MFFLEKYSGRKSRHQCPECEKKHCFTLYVDEIGKPLSEMVGRCDHETSCGYHYKPKEYYADNKLDSPKPSPFTKRTKLQVQNTSFIPIDTLEKSCQKYEANNFIIFLQSIFDQPIIDDLVQRYFIGSSNHWPGSVVFWQIDIDLKIRTGKIMQYDVTTGKRIKEPFDRISWVHSALKLKDFNLSQCLFGEHQLRSYQGQTIGIVESEKTAIIASAIYPDCIWLATGGKMNLHERLKKVLKSKKVILFPDIGAIDAWQKLPFAMCNLNPFKGKPIGYDLGDLLLEEINSRS